MWTCVLLDVRAKFTHLTSGVTPGSKRLGSTEKKLPKTTWQMIYLIYNRSRCVKESCVNYNLLCFVFLLKLYFTRVLHFLNFSAAETKPRCK